MLSLRAAQPKRKRLEKADRPQCLAAAYRITERITGEINN
jgi:hypothetical protein